VPVSDDYTKVAVFFIFLSHSGNEGGAELIEKRSIPRRQLLKKWTLPKRQQGDDIEFRYEQAYCGYR